MSRWREPRQKSAPYISPSGYRELESELKSLWQRRAEVSAAAAEGDRSENAEYIYRKKELRGIDSRIGYLQRRMPELKVVSSVENTEHVYFGACVRLEDEEGKVHDYRILGADELDSGINVVSIDSPLARALLGKSCKDDVIVLTGDTEKHYQVLQIHYPEQDENE